MKYLDWIRSQPCAICADTETVQAHHIIGHGFSIMGGKAPDLFSMPFCHEHHHLLHLRGWRQFEADYGISQSDLVLKYLVKAMREEIIDGD